MRRPNTARVAGFTIVELIAVLAIASLLFAMVSTRFFKVSSFDGVVAKDSVLALSRSAQQSALGRNNVQLTLTPSGSNVVVSSTERYYALRQIAERILKVPANCLWQRPRQNWRGL